MDGVPRPATLKFGPYLVDLAAGEVRKNGSRIRLQEKPLRVLALLAEKRGQLVTREELKKNLWPEDTFVDFETGLNTAVSKLRDALSDSAEKPRYIETIPRRGYRFVAELEIRDGQLAAAASIPREVAEISLSPLKTGGEIPEEPSVPAAKSKPAILSLVWISLGSAIAFLSVAGYWVTHGRPALSFHPRDSVLIADFENQTGDPRFDTALGTAFNVSMEQSRYANVFPRMQLASVLKRMDKPVGEPITSNLAREICQREGVRGLIVNSITRIGQEYALTAELIDPTTGQSVRSYTEHAYGDDHVLDALEVLSKDMREALGESLYQIHSANKPLPQVTTRSLRALEQYADGVALWERGEFKDAYTLLKSATSTDPQFAMAHAALGNADCSYIFNAQEEGKKEFETAISLSGRTTDRERMIIQTRYALDSGHEDDAARLFLVYLDRYPDDVPMRFDYGNLLRKTGRKSEAIDQYHQILRLAPKFAHAYIGIASTYKADSNFPAAIDAYHNAFEIDPHWLIAGNINREYGFSLVGNGEYQEASEVFSKLLLKPETRENGLRSLGFLDLYGGRYASAKKRFEQSLDIVTGHDSPLSVARLHLLLAIVAEGQGDPKLQRINLEEAMAEMKHLEAKVVFGAMLGDACARAGLIEQAGNLAALITPLTDPRSHEQLGYLHLLEGEIALARGQHGRAIDLLKQSDAENRTGLSLEALAHAYQQSGEADNAIASYQQMLDQPELPLGWEPQQRWLAARYTLAMDYSARGDNQKAKETLAVFLALWKDADPGLPLLARAKSAYAKLP